jgi:hypothetical protein
MQNTCEGSESLKRYIYKNEKKKIVKEKEIKVKERFEERTNKVLLTF